MGLKNAFNNVKCLCGKSHYRWRTLTLDGVLEHRSLLMQVHVEFLLSVCVGVYNLRNAPNGKNVLVSNKALFEPQCGYVMTMYFSSPSCNGYRLTLVINSVQFGGSLHHISETGYKVWSYKSYCNRRRFLRKLYKFLNR